MLLALCLAIFLLFQSASGRFVTAPLWLKSTELDRKDLFPVGIDNGKPYYIGRTDYYGEKVPGKVFSDEDKIWFRFNGKEYQRAEYEMLVYPRGLLTWVEVAGQKNETVVPQNIFVGGTDPMTGEEFYICRAWVLSRSHRPLVLGKLTRKSGTCEVHYGSGETLWDDFDILVDNRIQVGNCTPGGSGITLSCAIVTVLVVLLLLVVVGVGGYRFGWYEKSRGWWKHKFTRLFGNDNAVI